MINRFYCILASMLVAISSCQQGSRSQELDRRDSALRVREKKLSLIEEDYKRLLKMRDSLLASQPVLVDSVGDRNHWIDSLVGYWDNRLVCTATTCKGYVIGDRRNERWHFISDSTGLYLHVNGKADSVKVYRASYTENSREIVLTERDSPMSEEQKVLLFNSLDANPIRGQQRSTGADDCKTTFSIQLTPSANKL